MGASRYARQCVGVGARLLEQQLQGAPTDGSAWEFGECGMRVLRGGSWLSTPWDLRSAIRYRGTTEDRNYSFGPRVARSF